VTPHGAARKDREDGQEQARGKPAANAVGDGGAVTAKTPRMTSIPSHQRATDSHNYTRLVALNKDVRMGHSNSPMSLLLKTLNEVDVSLAELGRLAMFLA